MNTKICFMDWYNVQHGRAVYMPDTEAPPRSLPHTIGAENFFTATGAPQRQQMPSGIAITLEPAVLTESWLQRDRPWEKSCAWVTVIREAELFRCWYVARLNPPDAAHVDADRAANAHFNKPHNNYVLCYAESHDGMHWIKPELGLYSYNNSRNNNITCPYGKETAIFRDENAPPSERYKCFDFDKLPGFSTESTIYEQSGLYAVVSPDGLHWQRGTEPIIRYFCDTQNILTWDPCLKKYVGYFRGHFFVGKQGGIDMSGRGHDFNYGGRAIARAETTDFHQWPIPQVIMTPGATESPATDYYSNGFTWHPSDPTLRLMFVAVYHRDRDHVETRLALSRDGYVFNWVSLDPIIPAGAPGTDIWGGCYPGPNLLYLPDGRMGLPLRTNTGAHNDHSAPRDSGYCWATWSPDRLAGIESKVGKGEFFTMPRAFHGDRITINARTGPGGYILAELWSKPPTGLAEPVPGFSFADSVPFRGNELRAVCRWRGKDHLEELRGRDLVLRFAMCDAKIFSLQFSNS